MEFSENLKLLLFEKEMKQADLCHLTGIPSSLMSEYINGRKSPAMGNAIRIADAFGISLDVLAGRAERVRCENQGECIHENPLNESGDGLTEKEYTFLLDVLKALKQHLL